MPRPIDANFKEKLAKEIEAANEIVGAAGKLVQTMAGVYREIKEPPRFAKSEPTVEDVEAVYIPERKAAAQKLMKLIQESGWTATGVESNAK